MAELLRPQSGADTYALVSNGLLAQSVFMYWTTNNLFSIAQTFAMKHPWIRKKLNIPEPPKPDPNAAAGNPLANITNVSARKC